MPTTATKERPILFSGPPEGPEEYRETHINRQGYEREGPLIYGAYDDEWGVKCPYGKPGDRLWVRESLFIDDYRCDRVPPSEWPTDVLTDAIYYRADGSCCEQIPECNCATEGKAIWTPSIHMPRWASRITLEIINIRVERLQEISDEDAQAEGVERLTPLGEAAFFRNYIPGDIPSFMLPGRSFMSLWESINGAGSWAANSWVWVVEFKRIEL